MQIYNIISLNSSERFRQKLQRKSNNCMLNKCCLKIVSFMR